MVVTIDKIRQGMMIRDLSGTYLVKKIIRDPRGIYEMEMENTLDGFPRSIITDNPLRAFKTL